MTPVLVSRCSPVGNGPLFIANLVMLPVYMGRLSGIVCLIVYLARGVSYCKSVAPFGTTMIDTVVATDPAELLATIRKFCGTINSVLGVPLITPLFWSITNPSGRFGVI